MASGSEVIPTANGKSKKSVSKDAWNEVIAKIFKLEITVGEDRERIDDSDRRVEELETEMAQLREDTNGTMNIVAFDTSTMVKKGEEALLAKIAALEETLATLVVELREVKEEVNSCKMAVAHGSVASTAVVAPSKIPKSKKYRRTRNAKETKSLYGVKRDLTQPKPLRSDKGNGGGEKEQHKRRASNNKHHGRSSRRHKGNEHFGGKCYLCDGPHRLRECPKKHKLVELEAMENEHIKPEVSEMSSTKLAAMKVVEEVPKVEHILVGAMRLEEGSNQMKKPPKVGSSKAGSSATPKKYGQDAGKIFAHCCRMPRELPRACSSKAGLSAKPKCHEQSAGKIFVHRSMPKKGSHQSHEEVVVKWKERPCNGGNGESELSSPQY